jgi:hypothetical protein
VEFCGEQVAAVPSTVNTGVAGAVTASAVIVAFVVVSPTISDVAAVCDVPAVASNPPMLSAYVPAAVPAGAVTVIVVNDPAETEAGLKLALAPAGSPDTVKLPTVPELEPTAWVDTV